MDVDDGRQNDDLGPRSTMARRWLIVLFVLAAVPKIWLSINIDDPHYDGGYYTDVADHVRNGDGFVTDLSLYHQGFVTLPHPSPVYFVWPYVWGSVARAFTETTEGLLAVGVWLSTLLFFVAFFLAYRLGARLFPEPVFHEVVAGLNGGHILAGMLALNTHFFRFTSLPYTEGLAYVLLLVFLSRAVSRLKEPGWRTGLELGLWAGLLVLTRSQLFLCILAVASVLIVGLAVRRGQRAQWLVMIPCAAIGWGALVWPYLQWTSTFLVDAGLGTLLRFDQARGSEHLAPLESLVATEGVLDYLRDRGEGFLVAFSHKNAFSYTHSFGAYIWAAPVLLLLGLGSAFRTVRERKTVDALKHRWAWLRDDDDAMGWVFLLLLAFGGFLSLHTIHKEYGLEWNFHYRHALTAVFFFYFCMVALLRRQGAVLGLAILFLASGFHAGVAAVYTQAVEEQERVHEDKPKWGIRLEEWLATERDARGGKLTVIVPTLVGQRLAWRLPGVGFHWTYEETTPEELDTIVEVFDADVLVIERRQRRKWAMTKPAGEFTRRFRRVVKKLNGYEIWRAQGSIYTPRQRVLGADSPFARAGENETRVLVERDEPAVLEAIVDEHADEIRALKPGDEGDQQREGEASASDDDDDD